MDEDEEEEEEDDDEEEEEEDDDDDEDDEDEVRTHFPDYPTRRASTDARHHLQDESGEKIDPSAIIPRSRRAAAQRVDYSSEEALKKAGLTKAELEKDDDEAMES